MDDFAIVYFMTDWRADLAAQLSVNLTSLDILGLDGRKIRRYLTIAGPVDRAAREFLCAREVEVVQRDRLTLDHPLPNKALIEVSRPHRVVMYCDLDVVFLKDPTPKFIESAEDGRFLARPDLMDPLCQWSAFPFPLAYCLRGVGRFVWRLLKARYRRGLAKGPLVPYFNSGVFLCPGEVLPSLTRHWWRACSRLLRARRRRYPHAFFFTFHFYEQLSLSLGLEGSGIPFGCLGAEYNFVPAIDLQNEICGGLPAVCHLLTGLRQWYSVDGVSPQPGNEEVYKRVREVIAVDNSLKNRFA